MPLLDTQKITDDLTAAGVNNQQARLFASKMEEAAHIIRGDLTTKADLKATEQELRNEIQLTRANLKATEQELRNDIQLTRADLKATEQELKSEIQLVRVELRGEIKDMTNRFTLIVASLLGLAVAILKLWP